MSTAQVLVEPSDEMNAWLTKCGEYVERNERAVQTLIDAGAGAPKPTAPPQEWTTKWFADHGGDDVSMSFAAIAAHLEQHAARTPERSAAFHKLLDARDATIRALSIPAVRKAVTP